MKRGAYFKSDAEGTELILSLWLVKREDTIINYYKPNPLTIYPRENVGLLFKTDDGALTGIGLEVTVNRGFEGDTILNMTIPEYAWGDADEPEWGDENFKDILDETYANLKTSEKYNYVGLDYTVPAFVGKCLLTVSTDEEGSTPELYELTTAEGLQNTAQLGLYITDMANNPLSVNITETKQGRIHFSEIIKSLPARQDPITYTYLVQLTDALPANPNLIEATMVVRPKPVGESRFVGTNVRDYEVTHTAVIAEPISVEYVQDAGIQSSTLAVYRNNNIYGEYDVLAGSLPTGISYESGVLTFAKDFASHLTKASGATEVYRFEVTAVDNAGQDFLDSVTFTITMEPVSYEIVVPTEDIWGWKAKIEAVISGTLNATDLKVYLSDSEYPATWTGSPAEVWLEGLESGKITQYTLSIRMKFRQKSLLRNLLSR
ncbi:MAG: hypothetical protein LUD02_03485 [Tannerellaceae bacterium]|nr:hypothetical protein [Tannerellaceae bacterium]MCD8263325.1 hypothetical protein [Tannerellaceae bacterium]